MKTQHKIALARLAQTVIVGMRRLIGRDAHAVTRRRGIVWDLDLGEGIDFAIYLLGAFEPGTVAAYRRLIKPGDTVLDIGANIGAHALHFARAVGPGGKVIAFEPTDFAFRKLRANLALNPELERRVDARQTMLLDKEGAPPSSVYSSWPLGGAEQMHATHGGQLKETSGATAMTLDQALAPVQLTRLDFIKLDVDGFECHVLRGAGETLRRFHPPILMEIAPGVLEEQGESLEGFLELLSSHGYRLERLSSGRPLPMEANALRRLAPPGSSINVIGVSAPK